MFLFDDTLHKLRSLHASLNTLQNLERSIGASKIYLSPQWLKMLPLLKQCGVVVAPIVCGGSAFGSCFVMYM